MNVLLNNIPTVLPNDFMTIEELIKWKKIPSQGTAVAVNDKLIKQESWSHHKLNDLDQITIISASYGG